ncbi:hypothetical protein GS481_02060 [Rhodococcus hoagii]|nr:hypothetical protein [Prescottella equi]
MSMQYIRNYYRVPAKRGARIVYREFGPRKEGVIVGSCDQYLRVRFDDNPGLIETVHPTSGVTYVDGSAA